MSVLIDKPARYPGMRPGLWSHMWASDGDLEELHTMAKRIGLKREWFQDRPKFPHYDLTGAMPQRALAAGAIEITVREWMLGKEDAC